LKSSKIYKPGVIEYLELPTIYKNYNEEKLCNRKLLRLKPVYDQHTNFLTEFWLHKVHILLKEKHVLGVLDAVGPK
jgi:hypothetical protein